MEQNILNLTPPSSKKFTQVTNRLATDFDFFDEPQKKVHIKIVDKVGDDLENMDEKELMVHFESVVENWKTGLLGTESSMKNIVSSIHQYPWNELMICTFVQTILNTPFSDEEAKNIVQLFRDFSPSLLKRVDFQMKFVGLYTEDEIDVNGIENIFNNMGKVERFIRKCAKIVDRYKEWFEMESKIPGEYNFQEAFHTEECITSSITGDVQAGKTRVALKLAHKSIIAGVPVIMIILNRKAGHHQLASRISISNQQAKSYNREFKEWCEERGLEVIPLNVVFTDRDTITVRETAKSFLDPYQQTPGLIVVYDNVYQVQRALDYRNSIKTEADNFRVPYTLIVDEVDDATKGPKTGVYEPYTALTIMADNTIGITATSFKFWHQNQEVRADKIFILERDPDYRGILDLTFEMPVEEGTYAMSHLCKKDFLEVDTGFEEYVKKLSKLKPFEYTDLVTKKPATHPIICLYHPSDINKFHNQVFKYMMETRARRMKWCVIQYDGEQDSLIKFYDSDFSNKKDKIELNTNVYKPDRDGIYFIHKSTISELLGYICQNSQKHIMIVAGKLVSRQMSFVCDEYIRHLTHMRLLSSQSADCTTLMQQMRLCGVYRHDRLPLSLSCTESDYKSIVGAYKTQQAAIEKAQAIGTQEAMYELMYGDSENKFSFAKSHIPKRRLQKDIGKREIKTYDDSKIVEEKADDEKEEKKLYDYCVCRDKISGKSRQVFDIIHDYIVEHNLRGQWVNLSVTLNSIQSNMNIAWHWYQTKINHNESGKFLRLSSKDNNQEKRNMVMLP